MADVTIRRAGLLLALTAALLVSALILIGQAGADDGDGLPAPAELRVTAERGSLDVALEWDDVSGADSYLVRWRPAGPDSRLNDGVHVQSSDAVITVARYGEWVARVQACDDDGCGAPTAKKFRARKPRAVPDITPLPTSTSTPLPTSTPTPEPTATPTPLPTATPTPEPTTTSTPPPTSTPAPGTLQVSVTASSDTVPVNQPVSLTAAVSNAPQDSDPSYVWELNNGGGWFPQGAGPTLSYLTASPESWSFRVTVTYGSGVSATSGPITVTWVEIPPTPTATSIPEPTATPIPEPTATPTPAPPLPIPAKPAGLSVSAVPGSLDVSVDWDDVPGASYYWLRWRESGSGSELNEGVAVLPSEAVITVSGYGEWVARVQACNDSGCGAPAVSRFSVEQAPVTPGQPENLEVIAEPGSKSLLVTWDEVEGATSYKMHWKEDGGEFETDNAATASVAIWAVTVPDYGRWEVRVQGCNDSGCGPEAAATAEVVRAASLSLERAVDSEGNVRSRSVTANWDPVEGAASYTLSWQRLGGDSQANAQVQAQSAAGARQSRAVSAVSLSSGQDADVQTSNQLTFGAEETGADITLPDDGAYRMDLEAVDDDNELIAMASNQINQAAGQQDTTPPWLVRGEIDGDIISLHFSEPLDETATDGQLRTFIQWIGMWDYGWTQGWASDIKVSGNRVTVRGNPRAQAVSPSFRYWRAHAWYHPPASGDGGLRDLAGNPVKGQSASIQNVTGPPFVTGIALSSDPGEDGSYASGDVIKVKVTFNKDVNVTGTPRLKIDLDPATGGEKWASYASGSGARVLEFTYTVAAADVSADGVAVIENTLALNGGAIRGAPPGPADNARLAHEGLRHDSAHKIIRQGTSALVPQSASVSGTALTITFGGSLGAAASLSNDAFTVKKTPQGGTEQDVSLSGAPAVSGSTVALTLASAVLDSDVGVKVSYAKPTTGENNKLVDSDGAELADFSDIWVANTLDTTQPRLVGGKIDGDVMTLNFSEPLDERSGKDLGGDEEYFRLDFTAKDTSAPDYGSCLSEDAHSANKITTKLFLKPREVIVNGNTVVLAEIGHGYGHSSPRIRARVGHRDTSVMYQRSTDPNAKVLRDLAGNAVSAPDLYSDGKYRDTRWMKLDNVTQLPSPERATVDGDLLTLTFSDLMDTDSVPAAGAFTVKVNGSAVSLDTANPVAIFDNTVTLTLDAAVASGDAVTVSYDKPESTWLRNVICEYAPSFTDQTVMNYTP